MARGIVIGWVCASLSFGVGAILSANWYEYKMLPPHECALFQIAQLNPGSWSIAPNQPSVCYLRRSRLTF
jgi:hypothetical protein